MTKYLTTGAIVAAGILMAVSAFASTVTLSPVVVNVSAGQTFAVPVTVNPQGGKNYTVELKLNFPANLLQIKSFTFSNQWMALNQSGYSLVDNQNGVLIQTAGYPNGFNSNTQFGTVVFQAKNSGSGVISLSGDTAVFDQGSNNVFTGSSQIAVSVGASTATPTPTATPVSNGTVAPGQPTATVQPGQSPTFTESPSPEASVEPSTQQANIFGTIGNGLNLGTGSPLVAIIVFLGIILLAYWIIKRLIKK